MAKISSCKTVSITSLRRSGRRVNALVEGSYKQLWPSVDAEIQDLGYRNAKAVQDCLHTLITGNIRMADLNPEIQEVVFRAKVKVGIADPKELQMFESLLASCISAEKMPDVRSSTIHLSADSAFSRKPYNIRFHLIDALTVVGEWAFLGEIKKEKALFYIYKGINTFRSLYDLAKEDLGDAEAAVLREWYGAPKNAGGGVNVDELVSSVVEKYADCIPNLDIARVHSAVDQLVRCHCANLNAGFLYVTESLSFD